VTSVAVQGRAECQWTGVRRGITLQRVHAEETPVTEAEWLADFKDAELLGHLRGPTPHVRACWAVYLVLGRS
jgi:hypothetical protein